MRKVICLVLFIVLTLHATVCLADSIKIADIELENDEIEIKELISSFFDNKEDSFVGKGNFYLSDYFNEEMRAHLEKQTIYKLIQFEKMVRDSIVEKVSDEKFSYSIDKVSVFNDKANVVAYEEYSYYYANDRMGSSRGVEYRFEVEKGAEGWRVTSITTSNELETFVESIDNLEAYFSQNEQMIKGPERVLPTAVNSSYTLHWYSGVSGLNYAMQYSDTSHNNSTSAYNPLFHHAVGNDCQNFASQCIWAGLGGINSAAHINTTSLPMITDTGRTWYCTGTAFVSNWSVVGDFANYVSNGSPSNKGLFGTVGAKGQMTNGYAGDIVQIYDSSKGWYHSYFVNSATGTTGSRNLGDYYVCAHSTNRRNETLLSIFGSNSSASKLRIVAVTGSYY